MDFEIQFSLSLSLSLLKLDGRKEGASPPQDDSDLERKRREAEALLQSMGIVDASMGMKQQSSMGNYIRFLS